MHWSLFSPRWWEPETQIVVEFARTHLVPNGLVASYTEREIVCADADVAGSIDLIVVDPATGIHHIIDHKRSDKLQERREGKHRLRSIETFF